MREAESAMRLTLEWPGPGVARPGRGQRPAPPVTEDAGLTEDMEELCITRRLVTGHLVTATHDVAAMIVPRPEDGSMMKTE